MLIALGNGNYCSQSEYCNFPPVEYEISPLTVYGDSFPWEKDSTYFNDKIDY